MSEQTQVQKVELNDVFYTSWGYDQTNTELFKVVEISKTGKTCKVVQIGYKTVEGSEGVFSDRVEADPENILVEEPCTVKIQGADYLRGSVWFANGHGKHLQSLFRYTKPVYRSWGH